MNNNDIFYGLVNFAILAIIFLIVIAIVFKIYFKNFKMQNKNLEFYGLLLNLDSFSLIAISALIINYLFLIWCTLNFKGLNIIYISFTIILVMISDVVTDNFKAFPISLALTSVNCIAIQITYLIYNHLREETFSVMLTIILILVIIFVFLYYTYNLLRKINNIVIKQKYIKENKYKI